MTNHPVVITSTLAQASGSVIERVGLTGDLSADLASGVINFIDADLTDTHQVVSVVAQGAGYLGSFALGALADSTGGVTGTISWTFSMADGALDFLAAGRTLIQSYAVTIGDFHNGRATQIVTVTLTGSNDPTVIDAAATNASGSVTELTGVAGSTVAHLATGTIAFTDADLTDTHKVVSVVSQGPGYFGTLTLGPLVDSTGGVTGSIPWTFSAPDGALDFLAAGQTLVQKYTVTIGDFHNGPASQVVTVTLTGTNDLPFVTSTAAEATGSVTELPGVAFSQALDTTSGTLTFKDVDLADTHTATAVAQGAGYFGGFTVGAVTDSAGAANGSVGWSFAVPDGALDFLAAGQTLVQGYDVTIADNHGGTFVQAVTVTLTGTNDAPFIFSFGSTANGSITEQAGVTGSTATDLRSGEIDFADEDFIDTHKLVSVVPQATGYLGSFTLGALTDSGGGHILIPPFGSTVFYTVGTIPVSFSVPDGALDFLAVGQTLVQSYAVTIADLHNAQAMQIVTETLIGTNDPTVLTSTVAAATGTVTERAGVTGSLALDTASGTLTFKDVDLVDTHGASFAQQGAGYFGIFKLGPLTDSTNGATGSVGWTFSVVDRPLDFLVAGQTLVQKYNVTVDDGHGGAAVQLVTVTITGTNDVPVIGGVSAGSVAEDFAVAAGNLVSSGTLTIADADRGQAGFVAQAGTAGSNGLGVFTLDAVGHWTYAASNAQAAIQHLAAGQSVTDSFIATSLDATGSQLVTVTLHGTNDAVAMISTAAQVSGSRTEQAATTASLAVDTASGTIAFTDADLTDTHQVAGVLPQGAGYLGRFALGTLVDSTGGVTGSVPWTFSVADGALDFLAAGRTLIQSYAVTIGDFHNGRATQIVTVTLTGSNDPTVIDGAATNASGSVTELTGVAGSTVAHLATGTIAFTDADLTDTHKVVSVVPQGAGYLGSFALGPLVDSTGGVTGSIPWTFSAPDGALDFLAAGQTLVQKYTVTIGDFHNGPASQVATVTLNGTNDVPVIAGVSIGGVTEDVAVVTGTLATSGALTIADVDLGQSSFVAQGAAAGTFGTFTLDTTGHWTYTASNAQTAIQQLGAGKSLTDSFTATSLDGTKTQLITVTIGANGVPVIGGFSSGAVTEDVGVVTGNLVTSGALTIVDNDLGQSSFVAQAATAGNSGLGTFTLDTAGHWTYAASNAQTAIQQLGAGQSLTDSFMATSFDGTKTQLVTVTINGTNDVPVIGGVSSGAVTEDVGVVAGNLATAGALTIVDVDLCQSSFIAQASAAGGHGTFTLDTAGHWTYTASNAQIAIQQLGAGQSLSDSFTATSLDGTKTQLVTVTINGTNDVPVIGGVSSGAVTEDVGVTVGNLATSGALTIVDIDRNESSFAAQAATAGSGGLGVFTLDTAGYWTYTANNAQTAIQQLGAGQSVTDSFTATSLDGTGSQLVTVTLHGTNDAPLANPDVLTPAQAQGNLWTTLLANDADVDTAHNLLTITAVNTTGMFGTVSLNAAGHSLLYTAGADAGPDTFQYTISDAQGGTSSSTVTVNPDRLVTDNWMVSLGQTATFSASSVLANDSAFNDRGLGLFAVSGHNVTWDGTNITYTAPAAGASDSFTYTTIDSVGRHAIGTVNVSLWDGSSTPVGSAANQAEWLLASSAAPVTMIGSAGADRLTGGNGHAPGVNGGDTIIGGGGGDTLTGGLAFDHFIYNYGGPSAPNSDSHIGAMDTIADFAHQQGPLFQEVMELNGFGFTAASTASITSVTVATARGFTGFDKAGYFSDGNVVHAERVAGQPGSAQVYVDANQSGSFEAASDLVIHLDHLAQGLVRSDFQFH